MGRKPKNQTPDTSPREATVAGPARSRSPARSRIREALRLSEERYRLLVENTNDVIFSLDPRGIFTYISPSIERFAGYRMAEVIGESFVRFVHPDDLAGLEASLKRTATGALEPYEFRAIAKGGEVFYVRTSSRPLWAGDQFAGMAGVMTDVTERIRAEESLQQAHDELERRVEERTAELAEANTRLKAEIAERERAQEELSRVNRALLHAQKMEAIGRLAGGVAHDFNNMLGVILGMADLILGKLTAFDPLRGKIETIRKAAMRSAAITGQLLAFARRQTIEPTVINLNHAIASMQGMLARLIGEDLELRIIPGVDLWNIKIDPTQVDQILANLGTNARDAVEDVGRVTVETANVTLDEDYCRTHLDMVPGDYVMLAFSDTGRGMDAATQERIYEPFFTTKPEGMGTGLGLSTVYGIVKQNQGHAQVYSEVGQGTTFRIYLPRCLGEAAAPAPVLEESNSMGTETVLVAEDETQLLDLARMTLEEYGYRVITASTPGEAILASEMFAGEIHLLLVDVVMPVMNGRELRDRIASSRPGIKTVFMSGHTANAIADRGILDEGTQFIQKPFTPKALAAKVRLALNG